MQRSLSLRAKGAIVAASLPLVFALVSLIPSCAAGPGSSTGGKRVTLATVVTTDATAEKTFVTGLGWTVTISKAVLALGALYYFEGEPVLARERPTLRRPHSEPRHDRGGLLLFPEAHAHPGHYVAGDARGQMLVASTVDLLASPSRLPDGEGVTGWYRSARVNFPDRASGPLAGVLDGDVVRVEGEAGRGDVRVAFRARATANELRNQDGRPEVDGCPVTETEVEGDATLTLRVRPSVWFDQVDFGFVPAPSSAGAPSELGETQAGKAFVRGLKKGKAYDFSPSR